MFDAGQATSWCQEKGKTIQNIIQMSSTKLAFILHTLSYRHVQKPWFDVFGCDLIKLFSYTS